MVPIYPSPQGLRQGNRVAPSIGEMVSMPILNFLQDADHSAVFKCCISQESLNLVGYCFMDDNKIIQISPSLNDPAKYTTKISQEGLDIFSGVDQATGGNVSVKKTKWYLLEFKGDKAGNVVYLTTRRTYFFRLPRDYIKYNNSSLLKHQEL